MEPRFLLDTDTFIYIRRSQPGAVLQAFHNLHVGEAAISVITYGELIYGVAKSSQRVAALEKLARIVQQLSVLALPETAAEAYGAIRAELEAAGKTIGSNDLWIAAHAVAAGLTLVTNNEREFRRVRGLKIQNWAAR
jgi:tRNA(fMet)-specific endonuclease VapC